MDQFLSNPSLSFIRSDYPGNVLVNNRFVNEDRVFDLSYGKLLRWLFSKNPQRDEKRNDRAGLTVKRDHRILGDGPDSFVWLGHASFLFRINNKRILTDPALYSLPNLKRQFSSPLGTHQLAPLDYILLSHSHRDHFDTRSMREILRINPGVKIYCPLRMAPLVRAVGGRNVMEAGWYQEFPVDETGIRFVFLPAKHWNRRFMHDTNRELWGAFWMGTKKQSTYFAGDTAYHSHFADAKIYLPRIKHEFLPIGAYKPGYIMKHSHTSPEEAIRAFHDLGADQFIPMHYATFDLSNEPLSEPMRLINEQLDKKYLMTPQHVPGMIYAL